MKKNAIYTRVGLSKLLLIFLLLFSGVILGQSTANYTFSTATNGSLTDMSSGTTTVLTPAATTTDVASTIQNIGFTFIFMGTPYTQFSVNSNGLMRFGSTPVATTFSNSLATTTDIPFLAPFWDDLNNASDQATNSTSKVIMKVTGSAPNRVLTVEWKDFAIMYNGSTATALSTFQVRLYETTGVIEYAYGRMQIAPSSGTVTTSIGFTNTNADNGLLSVTSISAPAVATTTAGVVNNLINSNVAGDITDLNSTSDGSRKVYTFTPPAGAPNAPSGLNFTSVGLSGMTLNWTDNSDNESGFAVYRSDDGGTTYNYIAKANADAVSYPATGLTPGTNYYWQVTALNEGRQSTTAGGNQSTTTPTLSGTKTVGTGENYETLTAALSDITNQGLAGAVILELTTNFSGSGETIPIVLSNFPGLSVTNTLTIRPALGVTARSISTSNANPIFNFDGGRYITIDGRAGGVGETASREFSITNSGAGPVIQFINDAVNNTVKYCNLVGSGNTSNTSGVILFSTTSGTTGNDNNTIDYCDINALGSAVGICSNGTSGKENSGNTISNNNIRNFYINGTSTTSTYGIRLTTGSTEFTISGNSLYQEDARTYNGASAVIHYGISCNNTSGNNFVVTNNHIGGNSPNSTGTYTISSGMPRIFVLEMNVGTSTPSSVQGNTIRNIDLTTAFAASGSSGFIGIHVSAGAVNIGNISGNTIGSSTSTNSIVYNNTGTDLGILFVGANLASSGTVVFSNNIIGGLTANVFTTSVRINLYAISTSSTGQLTVSGNTVGSTTIANSIVNNAGNTATNFNTRGISSTSTNASVVFSNNTVANLTMTSTNTGPSLAGMYFGPSSSTTGYTVTGNTVYKLTTSSSRTSTGSTAPLIGIAFVNATSSSSGLQNISSNVVHSLSNTTGTAATDICGIYISNSTSTISTVANNFIHSFKHVSTGSSRMMGIYNVNCGLNIYNNMVRLGIDSDGSSVTGGYWIAGIWKETTQRNSIIHNSIYIGGTDIAGSQNQNTFAFRKSGTGATDSLLNNILFNARSNSTSSGKHYAVYLNNTTTLVSNNNIFYVNGTGGVLGFNGTTDQATLTGWQGTTLKDGNSGFGDPNYILPAGTSATLNLHVQNPTPAEGSGTAIAYITNDFDGDDRSAFTPVDIGADAGSFTALDIFAPKITYTAFNNTASTSNRTLASVTITDATGVPTSGSLQPRLWYRRSTDPTWVSTQGVLQSGTGTNGVWDFTLDYSVIPITPAVTETYQYYVAAQDGAGSPNITTSPVGGVHTDVNTQVSAPVTPNSYNIVTAYSGNYNVPGSYATLTGAGGMFEALNGGLLAGNVTITITGDVTEAGTNGLNQWIEEGAGNYTVTIQPNEAVVKNITGAVAQSMIRLNGCDRVTIDGRYSGDGRYLLFRNTNTSNSTINIQSDATNNVIRNCVIEGVNTTATQGVIFITPGTVYVTGNDNNTIRENQIKDGATVPANLIYSAGYSTSVRNSGNIIYNNELFNFTGTGIFLASTNSGNENYTVTGNTIYQGAARTTALYGMQLNTLNTANMVSQNVIRDLNTSNTAYGIYIDDVGTVDVTKNRIYNFPSTNGSTSTLVGIYNWGATDDGIANIYNNQISIIPSFTNAQSIYGIRDYANSGDISNIYYNSVYIGGTGSGTSKTYAFDDNSTSTFDILRNNLFINARTGGTGGHFAARSAGTSSITDLNSDYNFFAGNGPTLGNNFELSTTAKSFTDWKAAFTGSGKDANSYSMNAADLTAANLYTDIAAGDLNIRTDQTECWYVKGKGVQINGLADDYGATGVRSTTAAGGSTCIGSDEFTPTGGATTPPAINLNSPVAGANNIILNGRTLGTVTFAPVEATLPTSLEIQYFSGENPPPPLTGNYSKAYWVITATGGEGYSYDLTLNYDPAQIGTISSEDNIKLAKRNAGVWTHLGASTVNTTNKTITMTGLTSFSEFALSDNNSPLPVELNTFTAVVNGRDVTLNWSTKTEVSSNRFVVERSLSNNSSSLNGHSLWEKAGEVKASGNSNSLREYSFTDKKLNSGNYSYRLKMIDNDGSFDYSDVIEAEVEIPKTFALNQNYPNPFNPSTVISYQLPKDADVRLEIYGITGEKVATVIDQKQEAGYYNYTLSANAFGLSSGVYIYRIVAGEFVNTKKMVLIK